MNTIKIVKHTFINFKFKEDQGIQTDAGMTNVIAVDMGSADITSKGSNISSVNDKADGESNIEDQDGHEYIKVEKKDL